MYKGSWGYQRKFGLESLPQTQTIGEPKSHTSHQVWSLPENKSSQNFLLLRWTQKRATQYTALWAKY